MHIATDTGRLKITAAIDQTLALIATLPRQPAVSHAGGALDTLFETLTLSEDQQARAEAEDLIWALWCSHPDSDAERQMRKCIGAIAHSKLSVAESTLNDLIRDQPAWAEVWNKRATVHFLQGRDADSVAAIRETLEREPRHFGAFSGLGQICLRASESVSAIIAFEQALSFNPNLRSVRDALAALKAHEHRVLH